MSLRPIQHKRVGHTQQRRLDTDPVESKESSDLPVLSDTELAYNLLTGSDLDTVFQKVKEQHEQLAKVCTDRVEVKAVDSIDDLDQILLPKMEVTVGKEGPQVERKKIETLILVVDYSKINKKDLPRLNRNDFLDSQIDGVPIRDPRVGAQKVVIIPVNFDKALEGEGKSSDVSRRLSTLFKSAKQFVKPRKSAPKRRLRKGSQAVGVGKEASSKTVVETVDCRFESPRHLFDNGLDVTFTDGLMYTESQLANVVNRAMPGEVIRLTLKNVREGDKDLIRSRVKQLNSYRTQTQRYFDKDKPESQALTLPDGARIECRFEEELPEGIQVEISDDPSSCDAVVNSENITAQLHPITIKDGQAHRCFPLKGCRSIYVESQLESSDWKALCSTLEEGQELVVAPGIEFPDFLSHTVHKVRFSDPDQTVRGGGGSKGPLRFRDKDSVDFESLIHGDMMEGDAVSIQSVVTPDTEFEDLLSALDMNDDLSQGVRGTIRESDMIVALKAGKAVNWRLRGINQRVHDHLLEAAFQNDFWTLRALVRAGATLDKGDSRGQTAVLMAGECNEKMFQYLVDLGADINILDKDGNSPLMITTDDDSDDDSASIDLIEAGADVNQVDKDGVSPFSLAMKKKRYSVVEALIKKGVNVNQRDANGHTELWKACKRGDYEGVKLLMSLGADRGLESNGKTPLTVAAKQNHVDIVEYLLTEERSDEVKIDHLADLAVMNGHPEALRCLLRNGVDSKFHGGIMLTALEVRDMELLRICLEEGLDANAVYGKNGNLLYYAVYHEMSEAVEMLLAEGADPDRGVGDGFSIPIISAAASCSAALVNLLINANANVDQQAGDGRAALHHAANSGDYNVVKLLLGAGADKTIKSNRGNTAFDMAERPDIKGLLSN